MASFDTSCLVCGRSFTNRDGLLKYFCSVSCEFDAGPVRSTLERLKLERARAAKAVRSALAAESAVPQPKDSEE